ncbi:hypothetical protein SB780_36965, partial [Burkholderia sp. SIMBA_057]
QLREAPILSEASALFFVFQYVPKDLYPRLFPLTEIDEKTGLTPNASQTSCRISRSPLYALNIE